MSSKKIIAVVGATGAQGGGLARAILRHGASPFAVRALTRNPDTDKARALADAGAEVVRADLNDVDSLRAAFSGAHGAFCVTNYWELFDPAKELQQAKNLARAAADAKVAHVLWSTLEDVRDFVAITDEGMPTLMGKYKVPHFDAKGEADAEFTRLGVPTTFMLASFYWENYIYFGSGPQRGPDGILALTLPMGGAKLAGIATEDIGKAAYGIFQRGDEYIGKRVGLASDQLTIAEIATEMTRALGEEVRYNDVPADVYRGFGFPGAAEIGNMFQFYRDYGDAVLSLRSVEETRKLNPELQSLRAWLDRNASRIPIPEPAR